MSGRDFNGLLGTWGCGFRLQSSLGCGETAAVRLLPLGSVAGDVAIGLGGVGGGRRRGGCGEARRGGAGGGTGSGAGGGAERCGTGGGGTGWIICGGGCSCRQGKVYEQFEFSQLGLPIELKFYDCTNIS